MSAPADISDRFMLMRQSLFCRFLVALLTALCLSGVASAQRGAAPAGIPPTTSLEPLKFRYMGPAPDGRIASVAGVPGDPSTYYLGSASGGLWKSIDGGNTYTPILDDQPVSAIGSIAVADSDPKIVWVGTGEPWVIRYSDVIGDGVYRSDRCRGDVEEHGAAADRSDRARPHPPDGSEYRLRLRRGPADGAAGGARGLQDLRRRRDLAAHPVRRSENRLFRPGPGFERSQYAPGRNLAGRTAHMGATERWAGQRRLHHS